VSREGAALAGGETPLIRLQEVSKTFRSSRGDVAALEKISLDIRRGEFLTLVGPSGCGKSTLLRCLAGLERPSAGEIVLAGVTASEQAVLLGMVFQTDALLDWRTVVDNVLLQVELRGHDPGPWRARAADLLRAYGLGGFEERYPWELSGGMRQRVAICRAMLDEPPLLLMDEPFAALDAFTRDELNLELQRIWQATRKTVVFVTHSIAEAVFLSDRILVMAARPGRAEDLIAIDLPRPRPLTIRDTPDFTRYTARIRGIFQRIGVLGHAQ
jgi:NitT/TauT family transport system ATP-binding protein